MTYHELVVLALGWLLGRVSFGDIKKFSMFGPGKWRQFRIAMVEEQLKWDKRVHNSTYELCLYVFYELLTTLIVGSIMYGLVVTSPALSKNNALRPLFYFFIFVCVLSRLFRLWSMMHRLTNYDRELPKLKAKLEKLQGKIENGILASSPVQPGKELR